MSCVTKSISPCFETIKAVDGVLQHLAFHQARFDRTRKELYGEHSKIFLAQQIVPPQKGVYRVRVEYTKGIETVNYTPYAPRHFERFILVEKPIAYAYKYCDRTALHTPLLETYDDVIFTCKGVLSDTTIANIALLIDGVWQTPKTPLLKGTTRARLLASGYLHEAVLTSHSLQNAQKFAIMNALIGFKVLHHVSIKD